MDLNTPVWIISIIYYTIILVLFLDCFIRVLTFNVPYVFLRNYDKIDFFFKSTLLYVIVLTLMYLPYYNLVYTD